MNQGQFKDPLGYLYLAGTVLASLSPTQEVAGSSVFLKRATAAKIFRGNLCLSLFSVLLLSIIRFDER